MRQPPRRAGILGAAILVAALAAWSGSRIRLDDDIARLLPDSDAQTTRAAKAATRLMNRTVVDIEATTAAVTIAELALVADTFAADLMATGLARRVRARMDPDALLPGVELLREHAAQLLDPRQLEALARDLEGDRPETKIRDLAHRIQQVDGAHLKARASTDPLGITDPALAPLSALGDSFGNAQFLDGRVVSADGRHLLVLVEASFAPEDTEPSRRYVEAIKAAIRRLRGGHPDVRIRFAGAYRATLDNVDQIRSDVWLTSIVGMGCIALLAVLCFGRFWLALLALTPALFGGLCAWGTFALFQDTTSGAVLGFGAVLLGLTVDFAVHVLFRIDRGDGEGPATLPRRALLMGGTTTSLAFLALRGSSLPALRDVGLFGAVGILAAMLFALRVLPAAAPTASKSRPLLDLQGLVRKVAGPRMAAIILAVVATPLLAAGWFWLRLEGDPTRLSALSAAAAEDDRVVQQVWGPDGQTSALVVEAEDLDTALAANDRLRAWLDAEVAGGGIRRHASVSGLLPAPSTQADRLRAWREFWNPKRLADLRASLARATDATLFRSGAFAPFLDWIASDPEPLVYGEQVDGPLGELLEDRIHRDGDRWRITTPVFTDTWEQTAALATALAEAQPEVIFLNRQALARRLAGMVTGEIGWLGCIAFLLVATVVYLWHGRILITGAILLPLVLSLVWTIGLLGWLDIPISLANAIFVVLLFGVAVDYAIFLSSSRLERFRTRIDRVAEAQASVLLCTLTTCAGFGSLALAGHPVLHSIGLTALVGIFAAATTTQIFVPAFCDALLVRHGPNGTPGLWNAMAGCRVFLAMATRGVWHLVRRRRLDRLEQQEVTIDRIHEIGVHLRDRIPGSHPRFLDVDKLLPEPCILVANHESMYDIMAVLALPKRIQLLVKGWVWRMPLMGNMVRAAGYILAQETDPNDVFAQATERLARGHSLLIFPEGRRSRDGEIGRFHNGAFAIARALGCRVQPIAMVDTRSVVPLHGWWIGDHAARICVLDPMDPADFPGEGGDRKMARAARDRIRDRCRAEWPETQQGPRWHRAVSGMYRYFGPVTSHYAASKCKRDPLIEALPRLSEGAERILVAGCGLGLMTARMALSYPRRPMTCLDIDGDKLELARAALGEQESVSFVHADLREHPLPSVDFALLVDVLHYWDEPAQRGILERIHQVLEPGGTLLFRDGCADPSSRHWLVRAGEWYAVRTGFTRGQETLLFHSASAWRSLLDEAGFEVQTTRPDLGALSNVVWLCTKKSTAEQPGKATHGALVNQ